jgi:hypothetical protein
MAGLAQAALGEEPPIPAPSDPVIIAMNELEKGRYLKAIEGMRKEAERDKEGVASSMLKQVEPFVTGTVENARTIGPVREAPILDAALKQRFEEASVRDALSTIVKMARETRVVILNEAHNSPRDRAFALKVARALRPLGYSVLAVEAFGNDADPAQSQARMEALAKDGFPRLGTGFYTKDPVFGDFIRQALALGYRPVAYEHIGKAAKPESPEDGIATREQGQAENLMQRIFKDPSAKVLIHVGYTHVAEAPIGRSGIEWMAARLKKMAMLNPLTIDQTTYSEAAPSEEGKAYYALVADRVKQPSILLSQGQPLRGGSYKDAVDLQVVHPRTRYEYGRATWLRGMGRRPAVIPSRLLPQRGKRLIQAFLSREPDDAVPVDQLVVEAGRSPPKLMLPRAPVRLTYQDVE